MRSLAVEGSQMGFEEPGGLVEIVEKLPVEKLFAKATVEGFHVAVFPRRARFDVSRPDRKLCQVGTDGFRDELRAVVRANVLWETLVGEEAVQLVDDIDPAEASGTPK